MPKTVAVQHSCGSTAIVPYQFQVDVFLNPAFCVHCYEKFVPFSARFDEESDGSIEEFEETFDKKESILPKPTPLELLKEALKDIK